MPVQNNKSLRIDGSYFGLKVLVVFVRNWYLFIWLLQQISDHFFQWLSILWPMEKCCVIAISNNSQKKKNNNNNNNNNNFAVPEPVGSPDAVILQIKHTWSLTFFCDLWPHEHVKVPTLSINQVRFQLNFSFSNEVNFTFWAHLTTWPLMTFDLCIYDIWLHEHYRVSPCINDLSLLPIYWTLTFQIWCHFSHSQHAEVTA